MKYEHRILIGMTGALGKMGPQSQIITNRVAYQIGTELGVELKQRGLIEREMSLGDVWSVLNSELDIDPDAALEQEDSDGQRTLKVSISSCNICPKKVGKYAIPGTACPIGGVLKGVCATIGLMDISTYPDLLPGEVCSISIPLED